MKNKYIYILTTVILLLATALYFILWNTGNILNTDIINWINSSSWLLNNENIISESDKQIDISFNEIDPNNYESVNEFLTYFVNWSWVVLNVDLLEENFYINVYTDNWYIVTRFNKEFIFNIDKIVDKNVKNQAIMDIYNSYKIDKYILWEANDFRSWVRLLEEDELSSNMQLHNNLLLPFKWESFLETKNRLESKENKTNDDKQQLSYLYDFSWEYKKSLNLKSEIGIEAIKYKIEWRVFNLWNALEWAKVEILNYDNAFAFTNEKWEYSLEFDAYPLTRLRLRWSFDNLSDWYNGVYIIFDSDEQSSSDINFSLHKSDTSKLVNIEEMNKADKLIVKSSLWNEFEFKKWVLLDNDGRVYNDDFYAEIFEFNRVTPWMDNFLSLDSFDEIYWYVWDMMITNWMTYLSLKDLEWNELFISKKNPIITRQYSDIEFMLNNLQIWTSILTENQLDMILEKSKEEWYPIDNTFLWERWISWFAPWWVLNRTKWLWENNGIKLLNKSWLKESLYYNVD